MPAFRRRDWTRDLTLSARKQFLNGLLARAVATIAGSLLLLVAVTSCGAAPKPADPEPAAVAPLDIGGIAEWAHEFSVVRDGAEIGTATVIGKRVIESDDPRFRLDLRVELAGGENLAERQEFSLREPFRVVFAQYFEGNGTLAKCAAEVRKGPIGYKAQQFDGTDTHKYDINRPPYTLVDALAGRTLASAGEVGAELRATTLVTRTIEAIPTVWRVVSREPNGIVVIEKRLEPEGEAPRIERQHFDGVRLIRVERPDGTIWQ